MQTQAVARRTGEGIGLVLPPRHARCDQGLSQVSATVGQQGTHAAGAISKGLYRPRRGQTLGPRAPGETQQQRLSTVVSMMSKAKHTYPASGHRLAQPCVAHLAKDGLGGWASVSTTTLHERQAEGGGEGGDEAGIFRGGLPAHCVVEVQHKKTGQQGRLRSKRGKEGDGIGATRDGYRDQRLSGERGDQRGIGGHRAPRRHQALA